MQHYLLVVWCDIEPEIQGPFDTEEERDIKAREIRREEGDEHGLFMLDAEGEVEVNAYSGTFLN